MLNETDKEYYSYIRNTFESSRKNAVKDQQIKYDELLLLRDRIEEIGKDYHFCDGCGFCCTDDAAATTQLEWSYIKSYIEEHNIKPEPHTFVCPFLDFRQNDFEHNLSVYKISPETIKPIYCRIYPVRPIVCRLFPSGGKCRDESAFISPNFYEELKEYRKILDKYFYTLWWETLQLPRDSEAVMALKYSLIPGWTVDYSNSCLRFIKGPYGVYLTMETKWWHPPDIISFSLLELEIIANFRHAMSYQDLIIKYADKLSIEQITYLLTQLEFKMIIAPADKLAMRRNPAFFWEVLSENNNQEIFIKI